MASNVPAWRLWSLVRTQWRVGLDIIGLDYPAVLAVAAIHNITVDAALFGKIRNLELDTLVERSEKDKP